MSIVEKMPALDIAKILDIKCKESFKDYNFKVIQFYS